MRASRVLTFARYEVRRAVARKKVLALVALTVLIAIAPYYALSATHTSLITPPLRPYLWILGVFLPQAFFLQFTALLIAAGSMSEEYEQGTAEVLLSKPVSREEYFFGKYLGGYSLVVGIVLLDVVLPEGIATARVDLHSRAAGALGRWLAERGLAPQRPSPLMVRGQDLPGNRATLLSPLMQALG